MSEYDRYVLLARMNISIEQDGWFGTFVGPGDSPAYEYTTGLHNHLHPELIVVGLDPDTSHQLLWKLYDLIVNEGRRFADGDESDEVIDGGYKVRFKAVPPDGKPLRWSLNYYNLDELAALQVIWPDENGLFPGDEGCDEKTVEYQNLDEVREHYDDHPPQENFEKEEDDE